MFTFTSPWFLFFVLAIATLLFLIIIHFTRPGWRRLTSALVGGLATGTLNLLGDLAASSLGLWRYPLFNGTHAPLAFYAAAGIFYGAGMALIGWRIHRRFGLSGLLIFLGCFAIYGPVRDFLGAGWASANGMAHLIVFAPGPLPLLADALSWVGCVSAGQLVMRLLAGPPRADQLARPLVAWPLH